MPFPGCHPLLGPRLLRNLLSRESFSEDEPVALPCCALPVTLGLGIPHGNPLSFPQVLLLPFPFLERSWLADRVFFLERRVESPLMEK